MANHKAVNSKITVYPSIQKGVAKMKTVITRWLLWLAGLSVLFADHSMVLAYSVNGYAECAIAGCLLKSEHKPQFGSKQQAFAIHQGR